MMLKTTDGFDEAMTNLQHTVCIGFDRWRQDRDELARLPLQALEALIAAQDAFQKAKTSLDLEMQRHARCAMRATATFKADLELYLAHRTGLAVVERARRILEVNARTVLGLLDDAEKARVARASNA